MVEPHDSELLRMVIETAPEAVIVTDIDTMRIVDANAAACDMYGFSKDELFGMDPRSLSAEPDLTVTALLSSTPWIPLRHHLRRDGTSFPVEIAANQITAEGHGVRVAYIRDISSRLANEASLRASEARFSAAFRTSPDAVNLARIADGCYLDVNEGFTALTGYTAEEVLGKTSADLGIWAEEADYDRFVETFSTAGRVDDMVAGFRRKDGSVVRASLSARVIDMDGELCLMSVTRDISDRLAAQADVEASRQRLEQMVKDVAAAMGRVVESRDPYTQGHQLRVSRLSGLLARELGLPADQIEIIELAALVHDVGKLSVPAEILNKPGALLGVEFLLIKGHSEQGYEILQGIDFGAPIADIVLQHHERMDGSGYPQGLVGKDIRIEARIICVADVVEAMASHRPYRAALGLAPALDEIVSKPDKYDQAVVAACVALYDRGDLEFLNTAER